MCCKKDWEDHNLTVNNAQSPFVLRNGGRQDGEKLIIWGGKSVRLLMYVLQLQEQYMVSHEIHKLTILIQSKISPVFCKSSGYDLI